MAPITSDDQPDARPIAGGRYRLHGEYGYEAWIAGGAPLDFVVMIPDGFIWDGASVPRLLWTLSGIRPDGLARAAALVHDYIYRRHAHLSAPPVTRLMADKLFRYMIREAGGSKWLAFRAYWAVRLFGRAAWKSGNGGADG